MITISYRLKFRSDFHIGSGAGLPGVIDNGLKYDINGIPEINGKTIKGIVRDSVENLIYLYGDTDGQKILDSLFGQEGDDITCFRFSSPGIEDRYVNRIKNNPFLQKTISSIRAHNHIERETLTAKENALFFTEVSPYFIEYTGKILQRKDIDKKMEDKLLFYLLSGLRFVTHIGGNRRRGNGLVRFECITVKKGSDTIDWQEIIKKELK